MNSGRVGSKSSGWQGRCVQQAGVTLYLNRLLPWSPRVFDRRAIILLQLYVHGLDKQITDIESQFMSALA